MREVIKVTHVVLDDQCKLIYVTNHSLYIVAIFLSLQCFISASLICELFDLEDETINMVPFRFHKAYEARTGYKEKTEAGCLTSGHFTSVARLVTMSRNFMSVAANGMIFQYAALVLGAALTAGMFIFGNLSELSASVVCTYQAIMLIVTIVYQHLRRI